MARFNLDLNGPGRVLGVIIGAVVVLLVIASVLPDFFGALADVNENFTDPNTTTGSTVGDSLLDVFPIIIAVAGLFAIVGLILAALRV